MSDERKAALAAEYVAKIGYDPFADDPTISPDLVAQILAEHDAIEADEIRADWRGTGYLPAIEALAARMGWPDANARALAVYRRSPRALQRYSNCVVRARILAKISAGHAHITRTMGGKAFVALDYGPGRCSSSFVLA